MMDAAEPESLLRQFVEHAVPFVRDTTLPPIPELDTDSWRDRLVFPLGFDDDGRPFPLSCDRKPLPEPNDSAADGAGSMFTAGDVVTFEGGVRPGDIVRFDRVAADQVVVRVCGPDDQDDGGALRFCTVRGAEPGQVAFEPLV